jgi:hypothetical protein
MFELKTREEQHEQAYESNPIKLSTTAFGRYRILNDGDGGAI